MVDYDEVSDQVDEDVEDAITDEGEAGQSAGDWIIEKLTYFAGLPIFLSALVFLKEHNLWPDVRWKAIAVLIISFVLVFLFIFLLLHSFKYLVLTGFFIGLVFITVNSIRGKNYGFRQLGNDYKLVLWKVMNKDTEQVANQDEFVPEQLNQRKMPVVRRQNHNSRSISPKRR